MSALPAASRATSDAHPPLRANRNFARLWLGEGVSLLGDATTQVLLPALAIALSGGAAWLGALTAATWLPWLVIGLPAGAWVDRLDKRRVMIAADLLGALGLVSVPIAAFLGALTLPQLVIVAASNGTAQLFFRTSYAGFLTHVVTRGHLEQANARVFGTESAMQVAGPGLGAALLRVTSAAYGLALDAVSYLVSAVCLWRIRPEPDATRTGPSRPARRRLRAEIRDGIAFVGGDRYLRWMVVQGGLANLGLTGYTALIILFLARDAGAGTAGAGAVLAVAGVGGLLGATLAPTLARRFGSARALRRASYGGGVAAVLIPFAAPGWGLAWPVLGLFGVATSTVIGNVIRGAWRQRYVPGQLIGRAVSAFQFVNLGTMPLAGVLAGWLGTTIGVRPTVAVMATVVLLAEGLFLVSPFRSLVDLPEPAAA